MRAPEVAPGHSVEGPSLGRDVELLGFPGFKRWFDLRM